MIHWRAHGIIAGESIARQVSRIAAFQCVGEIRLLGDADVVLSHELHGCRRRHHGEVIQIMAVILAGIFVLLGFKGLQSRWLQTALSLVGIDVVLTLVTLPLLAINAGMAQSQGWIEGLYLLLVSWQLAAQSFVYHRAMNVGPFLGLGIALTLLVAGYAAVVMLVPEVVTVTR